MKIYEISQEIRSIMNEKPEPDERELTRRFLRLVSQNHRIKHYQVSQQDEAIIGADWLWLIYTNTGVYLLEPAKVLAKQINKYFGCRYFAQNTDSLFFVYSGAFFFLITCVVCTFNSPDGDYAEWLVSERTVMF